MSTGGSIQRRIVSGSWAIFIQMADMHQDRLLRRFFLKFKRTHTFILRKAENDMTQSQRARFDLWNWPECNHTYPHYVSYHWFKRELWNSAQNTLIQEIWEVLFQRKVRPDPFLHFQIYMWLLFEVWIIQQVWRRRLLNSEDLILNSDHPSFTLCHLPL